ncbi:zinc finger protein 595-like [Anopheles aquasalis]|uniref:zinc finger protein 595-like n=1 Tax=Anopheles aquasalis TaxID=42839 RepID=UPI00215AADD2|nr:zinc finger protein 595-like [Anopheles aquasalis]
MEICRLCMGDTTLDSFSDLDDAHIYDKINDCLKIEVDPYDKVLPSTICWSCAKLVRKFYRFRRECWKTQRLLLIQLKREKSVKISNISKPLPLSLRDGRSTMKEIMWQRCLALPKKAKQEMMIEIMEISPPPSPTLPLMPQDDVVQQYQEESLEKGKVMDEIDGNEDISIPQDEAVSDWQVDESTPSVGQQSDCETQRLSPVPDSEGLLVDNFEKCDFEMKDIETLDNMPEKDEQKNYVNIHPDTTVMEKQENMQPDTKVFENYENIQPGTALNESNEIMQPVKKENECSKNVLQQNLECFKVENDVKLLNEESAPNTFPEYVEEYLDSDTCDYDSAPPNEQKSSESEQIVPTRSKPMTGKALYQSLLMKCSICDKEIERNRMEGHINKHKGLRPYQCGTDGCTAAFHCKHARRLHIRCRHGNDTFPCDICGKVYKARRDLLGHKRETHGEAKFECDICQKRFTTRSRLKQHRNYHVGERKHACPVCPSRFFNKFQLRVHARVHTGAKPFACRICSKFFTYRHLAKEHIVRHHGIHQSLDKEWIIAYPEEEIRHETDSKATTTYNEMDAEELSKLCRLCMADCRLDESCSDDKIRDKVLECLNISLNLNDGDLPSCICSLCAGKVEDFYQFRRKCWVVQESIVELIRKHYSEVPEMSPEQETDVNDSDMDEQEEDVAETEANVTSMDVFIELAPNRSGDSGQRNRPLQNAKEECLTCGKLVERVRMDGHRNRHLGLEPYQCLQSGCTASFACKVALRLHRNNLHSEGQYPCSLCDRVFTSKKKYYDHKMNVHSGKCFSCDICGARFSTNIKLNRHTVIHSSERPFACQLCPKAFYRNSNLKVHMRSHTKEKPFICPVCSKPFGYSRLVKQHLMRVHGETGRESPIMSEVVSA